MVNNLQPYINRAEQIEQTFASISTANPKDEDAITQLYLDTFKLSQDLERVCSRLNDREFTAAIPDVEKMFVLFKKVETLAKSHNLTVEEIQNRQNAKEGEYYQSFIQENQPVQKIEPRKIDKPAARPSTDPSRTLEDLKKDYKNKPPYIQKIAQLERDFRGIIPVRGDGNCFYRAIYIQQLTNSFLNRSVDQLQGTIQSVKSNNPQFNAAKEKVLQHLKTANYDSPKELIEWINQNPDMDKAYIQVFRHIASNYLRENADAKAVFGMSYKDALAGRSVDSFCKDIERMDKDAEDITLVLLPRALKSNLNIATLYADQASSQVMSSYTLPGAVNTLNVLYRPDRGSGHYDLLY